MTTESTARKQTEPPRPPREGRETRHGARLGIRAILFSLVLLWLAGQSLANGSVWQFLGPEGGGEVTRLVYDPIVRGQVYAVMVGNRLFRSWDGGETWNPLPPMPTLPPLGDIVIDPVDSSVLYAVTRQGIQGNRQLLPQLQILRSPDRGQTWQKLPPPLPPVDLGVMPEQPRPEGGGLLVFDPTNPKLAYTAGGGMARSGDGGASWTPLPVPDVPDVVCTCRCNSFPPPQCLVDVEIPFTPVAIAVDPTNSSTVFAGGSILLRSQNGGDSWEELEPRSVSSLVIDPVTPTTLYAAGISVWRSIDQGESWEQSSAGLPSTSSYLLTMDHSDPKRLYVAIPDQGVFVTTDGAETWVPAGQGLENRTLSDLAIDPWNPTRLLTATDRGIFLTTTSGESWDRVIRGLGGLPVSALAFGQPDRLYALGEISWAGGTSLFGGNFLSSADAGANWEANEELSLGEGPVAGGTSVAVDPSDPSRVLISSSRGVHQSKDGGETWVHVLQEGSVNTVVIDLKQPSRVFAGSPDCRIRRSLDGGDTWSVSLDRSQQFCGGSDPFSQLNFVSIEIDPVDPSFVYAVGFRYPNFSSFEWFLFRSADGGGNWIELHPAFGELFPLQADPQTSGVLYAIPFSAKIGTGPTSLYRSIDRGDSWQLVSSNVPEAMQAPGIAPAGLHIDPRDPHKFYLLGVSGVFSSNDSGVTWTHMDEGLPDELFGGAFPRVRELVIPPNPGGPLYLATEMGIFAKAPVDLPLIFPQFFNGGNSGSLQPNSSRIIVRNSSASSAQLRILFRDGDGEAVPVPILGEQDEVSELERSIEPFGVTEVETAGTGGLQAGVVEIASLDGKNGHLSGTLVFSLFGTFVSIDHSAVASEHQILVSYDSHFALGENTGVAVYNPDSDSTSLIRLTLRSELGEEVAVSDDVEVAPREQFIGFVDAEIFFRSYFDLHDGPFLGTLDISVVEGPEVAALSLIQKTHFFNNALVAVANSKIVSGSTLLFPQFINGGDSGGSFEPNASRILVRNESLMDGGVRTRFFDGSGTPVLVPVEGEEVTELEKEMAPRGVVEIETDGTGVLRSGVVRVESSGGSAGLLNGTLVFSLFGTFVSVGSSPLRSHHQVFVSVDKDPVLGEDTGVAVHNPDSETRAVLRLALRNENGEEVAAIEEIEVAPGQQLIGFVTAEAYFKDYFDSITEPFIGTLEVSQVEGPGVAVLGLIQKSRDFNNALVAVSSSADTR